MRNKLLFERKLEQLESKCTAIEYHVSRLERPQAYQELDATRELLSSMKSLLNTEEQDQ